MADSSSTRRRLLAAATALSTGALAGCFEEVDDPTAGDGVAGDGGDDSGPDEDDEGDVEPDADGADDETGDEETDTPDPTPEPADPAESGLRVVETDHTVRDDGTIEADITVENVGEYTYSHIELRVDAYYSSPGRSAEEAVGHEYAEISGFSSGTRTFEDVEVDVDSSATDPDRFRVDAAVRRADPE
ncbi:hypothetical protein [Halorubrum gandharaense]